MKSVRYDSLEGLRGLMAFWVWVTHVTTMATLPLDKHDGWGWIFANGEFAVGVFIILSGFVISMTLNSSDRIHFGAFWIRRAFRLFPIYLVCLFVSVAILSISIDALQQIPWSSPRTDNRLEILEDSKTYFWQHLTLHSLLLHGIVPDRMLPSTSFAFMGQAWSLTLEWQFYLFAPFAFLLLARFRTTHLLHAAVMIATILLSFKFGQPSFLLSYLYLFAAGYFGQRFLHELQLEQITRRQILGYLLVELLLISMTGESLVAFLIWMSVYLSILYMQGGSRGHVVRLFESPAMLFLGKISYCFYCVHMIVIYLVTYTLIAVLEISSRPLFISALIAISCVGSLALAYALHKWIEMPMLSFGKDLAARAAIRESVWLLRRATR